MSPVGIRIAFPDRTASHLNKRLFLDMFSIYGSISRHLEDYYPLVGRD